MSGVEPNPRHTTVNRGAEICRREKADAVLAVGGGSTIDCCKAVAAAYYDLTHGLGLAILTPRWMEFLLNQDKTAALDFAKFGVNVMRCPREADASGCGSHLPHVPVKPCRPEHDRKNHLENQYNTAGHHNPQVIPRGPYGIVASTSLH